MSETDLVERLERLERAHRRLKGFAITTLVLATALVTIYATQPVPRTITAHEFNLVDDSGNVRVRTETREGGPGLALYDAQGKLRAVMSLDSSGAPSINLDDAQEKGRAVISLLSSGGPGIVLLDAQGEIRADMSLLLSSDAPVITFYDKEHHVVWQAP